MQCLYVLLCLLLLAVVPSALAVLSDDGSPPVIAPGDPDQAAARAAFQRGEWQGVVDNMAKVIERRPWDDDAHNLMGFAYRKLGNYRQALIHYQRALDLNPHHRGVLEYLGEAYVDMGCIAQAREALARLEAACKRLASGTTHDWKSGCGEWQDLQEAITAYRGPPRPDCSLH
jgi:tetratricopeptide (TPR) repeat protein